MHINFEKSDIYNYNFCISSKRLQYKILLEYSVVIV